MMQRVVTVCIGMLLLAWQGMAAVAENELVLYGAVINTTVTADDDEDTRGDILEDPKRIRILNLGKIINHSGLDYGPTISADGKTLYFVSNRAGSRITRDGDFSHDFWSARKENNLDTVFSLPVNIDTVDAGVNTIFNEGVATIAADRQTLFFTGCNRPDGLGDCDLYVADVEGDRWGKPRNLGRNVNSEFWDSQPTISPDKQRIYFTSNRPSPTNPDGDGRDMDIWYCDWDDDLAEWKPAKNLGPDINTDKMEVSPFIAADGNTLFFSSDGHKPNLGGLDFYRTRRTGQKDREGRDRWAKPEQLPAPINTPEDEQFITLPASGDVLYFSSRRTDLPGYQGDLDIFMAFIPRYFRAVNIIVNVIDECTQSAVPAKITFKNMKTGKVTNSEVTTSSTESNIIVTNDDYGTKPNRSETIQYTVTASSAAYGSQDVVVDVTDPGVTTNPGEAGTTTEIRKTIVLGRRPTLAWEAEFPDAVKKGKVKDSWKGLLTEERASIKIYPPLPYVFFDLKSSEIPSRYILFKSPSQTANFDDERIPGGTLDKYYHVLNVLGYRLKNNPGVKVKLVGCVDEKNETKDKPLTQARAEQVFNYLRDIWGIDAGRMSIEARGAYPETKSNPNDTLGVVENRRVEIRFEGDAEEVWRVARPIVDRDPVRFPSPANLTYSMTNGIDNEIVASRRIEVKRGNGEWATLDKIGVTEASSVWDFTDSDGELPGDRLNRGENDKQFEPLKAQLVVVSKNGTECRSDVVTIPVRNISSVGRVTEATDEKTLERYNLILFPFDRSDAGPMNERILREYVYGRVKKSSDVMVEGHTDVVGMDTHNKGLSQRRAATVEKLIRAQAGGAFKSLTSRGTGEEEPLYNNNLPEERFFNRTVFVQIETPLQDADLDK
ncbi:MAG TPA: OmpA family protein [Chlorobiota bacterium]|nr:OmpA family protein [Chlorobiota bacterium]